MQGTLRDTMDYSASLTAPMYCWLGATHGPWSPSYSPFFIFWSSSPLSFCALLVWGGGWRLCVGRKRPTQRLVSSVPKGTLYANNQPLPAQARSRKDQEAGRRKRAICSQSSQIEQIVWRSPRCMRSSGCRYPESVMVCWVLWLVPTVAIYQKTQGQKRIL
jgi:hypothetical protein